VEWLWSTESKTGIVDQDVDGAGLLDDAGDGGGHGGAGAYVAGTGVDCASCIAELGGKGVELVGGAGEEDQSTGFGGECAGDGGADAEGGAGDEDGFVCE